MRLMRPISNKENIESYPQLGREKDRWDELRLQLKSAYSQLVTLREANKQLLWRVEMSEKEAQGHRQSREELEFLREQDANVKQQLRNYEDINRRLREELERSQKERMEMAEQLTHLKNRQIYHLPDQSAKKQRKIRESSAARDNANSSRSASTSWQQSMRTSSCMSGGGQRGKENHCMTPKSKMRINLEQLIPQNINQRRRVFL